MDKFIKLLGPFLLFSLVDFSGFCLLIIIADWTVRFVYVVYVELFQIRSEGSKIEIIEPFMQYRKFLLC